MKFIHAADLHIDSPLRDLTRYESAPVDALRGATRRAFERLVDLALAESVACVILAGDLYDGEWQDIRTGLYFAKQMARLSSVGIRVFIVKGNHDAESKITKHLPLPKLVHVFSSRAPESVTLDSFGVAVHGQSFGKPAVMADLAAGFPARKKGFFNIGVLHTSLTGREGHAPYAPCDVDTLRSKGYDYWALGHVHAREVVSEAEPRIVFPGNLQGRHARETGSKGCELVTVEGTEIVDAQHFPLDVVRWAVVEIDVTEQPDKQSVLEEVRGQLVSALTQAEERLLAVRLVLRGRTRAHRVLAAAPQILQADVQAVAFELGQDHVWVEQVLVQTTPNIDLEAFLTRDDPVGTLLRMSREWQGNPAQLEAIYGAVVQELKRKLPPELAEGEGAVIPIEPGQLRNLLQEIEKGVVPDLLSEGDRNAV